MTGPERRIAARARRDAIQDRANALVADLGDALLSRLESEFPDHGDLVTACRLIGGMLNEAIVLRHEARADAERIRGDHDPIVVPTLRDIVRARDRELLDDR